MKSPTDSHIPTPKRRIFGLNANIFSLGMVSLLTDVSSELIFTLLPLFLANVLRATTPVIGLVGGLTESADAILRIFSGWFSDRVGKRKLLAVLGYSISTAAKPFMYLAASPAAALVIKLGDRVGKGIRTSPRDALVADSVSAGERGKGFGLHRAMDTFGAMLGLIIGAVIVYRLQGSGLELDLGTYRWLVLVGTVPAVLAVAALLIFVRDVPRTHPAGASSRLGLKLSGLDGRFRLFLAIIAVFTLGNSSDFFVILRAQDLGTSVFHIILMLVVFNLTYAGLSVPAGMLSDRLGRRRMIIMGWGIYALVYLGLAVSAQVWQVWLLFVLYGAYYGIFEGVARAFVADLVPMDQRGTAYGLYHGVIGLALLPASLLAGWLWQAISPAAPFYFGASLALLATLGMVTLLRR